MHSDVMAFFNPVIRCDKCQHSAEIELVIKPLKAPSKFWLMESKQKVFVQ